MTDASLSQTAPVRPHGLSAFVRCRNEEEYIVASLLSAYRIFDELVVILNRSEDRTRELVEELAATRPKIRIAEYAAACSAIGAGYDARVAADPSTSIAQYYNWCLEQTRFSHVCKWDGDMIATPEFERARGLITGADVVQFDGYDVLGEHTTDLEPRIFRFDPARARYVDWDLYEVLQHDYARVARVEAKCYLHMKLVKREWRDQAWVSPNLSAVRAYPAAGVPARGVLRAALHRVGRVARRALGRGGGSGEPSP